MKSVLPHSSLVVILASFAIIACGGAREQFLGSRVKDTCNGQWPVCDTQVGCVIGDRSYIEGRFPGTNAVSIQVFEPSTVTLSFFLDQIAGAGSATSINFNEDGCRARTRLTITGREFLGENEQKGYIKRSADLSGIGDHLISWESDARTTYAAKIDVLPLRLKGTTEN